MTFEGQSARDAVVRALWNMGGRGDLAELTIALNQPTDHVQFYLDELVDDGTLRAITNEGERQYKGANTPFELRMW